MGNYTMSMVAASPLQIVQGILQQQKDAGRPAQDVCIRIANLKDLVEIGGGGAAFQEWRRGGGNTPSGYSNSGRGGGSGSGSGAPGASGTASASAASGTASASGNNSNNSNRMSFRTGPSDRSPDSGSATPATPGTPGTPFRRNASYNSTDSHGLSSPIVRYQSKFKNSNQPVESKILNNIILLKLNKFSPTTYNDIRDFLYQILGSGDSDLSEMIRDFMMLVFRKAASEEVYCALYAKLLAEISARYKVILEEMHKLQANYLEVFDDVVEVPEGGEGYEEFVAKNREKRYRQGYSQFLAELAALEILSLSTLQQSVQKLISCIDTAGAADDKKTLVEEYVDCLVRMSRVLRKKRSPFAESARTSLLALCGNAIQTCISQKELYPSMSPKSRFLLMDVKDILEGK